MNIIKYPDGTSYAVVHPTQEFTFRINSYEDLWHLNQIVDAQNNLGITPTITIPNLIDAQADRRFTNNQSSGLKLVCKFLNSINAYFKIFHPHNPEVVEALMDNVKIIDNSEFVTNVLSKLNDKHRDHNDTLLDTHFDEKISSYLTLMSSDAGGFKPLMKLCDKINWTGETASASKARSYEEGKTTLHQIVPIKDFNGKDILIIDDICVYGGTFKGLSKLLKERNCGKLYLAVSHMTVQNLGEDPVTNYFDKVYCTNSKYDNYTYKTMDRNHGLLDILSQPKNLEIIKLF